MSDFTSASLAASGFFLLAIFCVLLWIGEILKKCLHELYLIRKSLEPEPDREPEE